MKVLLINQSFWPDVAATGQLLTDVARHLSTLGHEVTVICSRNMYGSDPAGEEAPDVRIIRVPGPPFARSVIGRGLSYICFFLGALWKAFCLRKTDLVVTLTTPPLLSLTGTLLKKTSGAKHYIWEMDLFPDALVSLKALRAESLMTRLLGVAADYSRKQSDGIIALGECMQERLTSRGISPRHVYIAENWADGRQIRPVPRQRGPVLNLLYSGNLGLSHDIETISSAMLLLRDDPRFHFTFAGGGARRSELQAFCEQQRLTNVSFMPYSAREDVSTSLSAGDIGVVTERPECLGTVVPSKVYGLMAAGRPILFIGPRKATPSRIVRDYQCGWHVDCGQVRDLTELLDCLYKDREAIEEFGARGRAAFLEHYDLHHGLNRISRVLGLSVA